MSSSAIRLDGTLWMFGNNSSGQLGDNTITHRSSPVQTISSGTNWAYVSSSSDHTCAIKQDGSLWCWGANVSGQLGDDTRTPRSSPVQTIAGGTNWSQVACGRDFTFAIKNDNTLWCWGENFYGNLGTDNVTKYSSPVQTISGGTDWASVAAGWYHTAAIKTNGSLWCWGRNEGGAPNTGGNLGDNTRTHRSSPVQTVAGGTDWSQVACGDGGTSAVKTDGTLWGFGRFAILGDNTSNSKSSPVQTISGGTNWSKVHLCEASAYGIKTDGRLWVWGLNNGGELADNTTTSRSSPIQTFINDTNWYDVSGFADTLIALRYTTTTSTTAAVTTSSSSTEA